MAGRVWVQPRLTNSEKKEIIKFRVEYPCFSCRAVADIFSEKWNKKLNRMHILQVDQNQERILEVPDEMEKVTAEKSWKIMTNKFFPVF